jgi:hypothetical protein
MTPRLAPVPIRWWLLLTGHVGITLPPFGIFMVDRNWLASDSMVRHEHVHWQQWQRMGTLRFYATYLWLLARHGYQRHPMEIEARNAEANRHA